LHIMNLSMKFGLSDQTHLILSINQLFRRMQQVFFTKHVSQGIQGDPVDGRNPAPIDR